MYCIAAFISTYTIIAFFLVLFQCSPVDSVWIESYASRKCLSIVGIMVFITSCNVAADLVMIAFVVPQICSYTVPS